MNKKHRKIWILAISLVLIAAVVLGGHGIASASSLKKAENTARQMVPQGAVLEETQKEQDEYEFTFYDEGSKGTYEVTVSRKSGSVKKLEIEFSQRKGAETPSLTEDDIKAFVLETYPGAEIILIQLGIDDGLYSYEVSFHTDSLRGSMEINAATKEVMECTLRYGTPIVIPSESFSPSEAPSILTEDQIRTVVQTAYPNCSIYSLGLDYEDGRYQYEVKFYTGHTVYEAEYDASTGALLKEEKKVTGWQPESPAAQSSSQPDTPSKTEKSSQPSSTLDEDTIRNAALSRAEGSDPQIIKIKLDKEDGRLIYEGKMKDSSYQYEFEMDAYTGTVLKWERKATSSSAAPETKGEIISKQRAGSIAAEKAGGAAVITCELDQDGGKLSYELELKDSQYQFEFEIDAYTGAILDWSKEPLEEEE